MDLCRHFDVCGGCKSQDIPYERQLKEKEERVHTLFSPFCDRRLPIIGSDPHYHYRSKMELSFSQTKAGEKFLGLRMSGKRGRVFLMEECHLCPPWMVEVAKSVYKWWQTTTIEAYFPPKDKGALRTLTLRMGDEKERMVILTVSGNEAYTLSEEEVHSFTECIEEVSSIILLTQVIKKKTPTRFFERVLYGKDHLMVSMPPFTFRVRPQAFFQPNRFTAQLLYQKALSLAALTPTDTLYDLYCGTATLGIFASSLVNKVLGVELNEEAVSDAKENILLNKCSNVSVLQGAVGKVTLPTLPTVLLVDPPRAGLEEKTTKYLLTLQAKKILYISCNPKSQVNDIEILIKNGYKLNLIQPIDQFPHTKHIENIALLEQIC